MTGLQTSSQKARLGRILTAIGGIVAAFASFGSWTKSVTIVAVVVLVLGFILQWLAERQKAKKRGELSEKLGVAREKAAEDVSRVLVKLASRLDLGNRGNLWRVGLYEKRENYWERISRICPDRALKENGREVFLAEDTFLRSELGGADSREGRTYVSPVFPDPAENRAEWEDLQIALGVPESVAKDLRFPVQRYLARICWVDGPDSSGRMLALVVECTVPDALTATSFQDMAPTSWFDSVASALTSQEQILELELELADTE